MTDESNGSESDLTVHSAKETPPTTPSTIVASLDKSILQVCPPLFFLSACHSPLSFLLSNALSCILRSEIGLRFWKRC
jgi:hypothetical protein